MSSTFAGPQLGIQLGTSATLPTIVEADTLPRQRELPVLAGIAAPSVVNPKLVAACRSYRDAVRLCFVLRRVKGMCLKSAAEHAGIHVPHMSDFMHADDAPTRRDMPAKYIPAFESICGNTAISQYIARCAGLTVADEAAFQPQPQPLAA